MNGMENTFANRRTKTDPLKVPMTDRKHLIDVVTSSPAGKMIPVAAIPLLHGDSLKSTTIGATVAMDETADALLNSVNVKMSAYLVPTLAFERFNGDMNQLIKSYHGKPPLEGSPVVDYIEKGNGGLISQGRIQYYLGMHPKDHTDVNLGYIEAYNTIWNWRAKNRSKNIDLRTRLDVTVAPAFWNHKQFQNIVSSFDLAMITGEIDLDISNQKMDVKGIGFTNVNDGSFQDTPAYESNGTVITYDQAKGNVTTNGDDRVMVRQDEFGRPDVYAELVGDRVSVSLAEIAEARRTEEFAKLRQQYSGLDEDWEIDRLMAGLQIPDKAYTQPILLDSVTGPIGSFTRYSTTAGSLDVKTVNGAGDYSLRIATPRVECGGIVMVMVEILPEQVFERQMDYYLEATDTSEFPNALLDAIDQVPVTTLTNAHVDTGHSNPDDTFGYTKLNGHWNVMTTRIGGKYYRGSGNSNYIQDRENLWLVEATDPTISTEWYVSETMNQNPFFYKDRDPFSLQIKGMATIKGLTQFGDNLSESDGEYDYIKTLAPDYSLQTSDVSEL